MTLIIKLIMALIIILMLILIILLMLIMWILIIGHNPDVDSDIVDTNDDAGVYVDDNAYDGDINVYTDNETHDDTGHDTDNLIDNVYTYNDADYVTDVDKDNSVVDSCKELKMKLMIKLFQGIQQIMRRKINWSLWLEQPQKVRTIGSGKREGESLTFRKTKLLILFVIGKAMYQKWVIDDVRHLLHILEDLPSCRPPVDHLLELLPRYTRVS